MAEDLHAFISGQLWSRLKQDVHELRIFNRRDLAAAAYFHVRRLLLIQPGWSLRTEVSAGSAGLVPDLVILQKDIFQAVIRLEFHMAAAGPGYFPDRELSDMMAVLRDTVVALERSRPAAATQRAGRGYLLAVYDSDEPWFYPDSEMWEKQSCHWLPVNCHDFPEYVDWRARWDRVRGAIG